jgi:hypothetical protein
MGEIVKFNKDALIEELKQIHKDMVSVYKELFTYKYENNEDFRNFIEKEYRENGIANDDKEKWNDNFCHRTSYTLINKVLFIRICEDKGFMFNPEEDFIMGEPKDPNIGKKLSARGRDRWISLISNYTFGELLKFAFADMKESFKNIALFKEDKYEKLNPTKQELELKFMLDSKEYKKTPIYSYEENVAKIIEKLDTSKFDFNVPAEGNILGDVYEKFMDRETRKAIGQFYTPDFVIEYILNNTVAEADVVENPFVSVLDPACGSGHFLIMAYDILRKKFEESIDKLREKYADVDYVYKNKKMKGKEYWVKDRIHYHILKHCIFGADIDSFAVQLTTINLLLKDLDNFTDELNIMECDSLIKWEEDYDWQDLKQQLKNISMFYTINYKDINGIHRHDTLSRDKAEELVRLCEFWAKKYDYVVGNPPYMGQKGNKEVFEKFKNNDYWKQYYERKQDIYYYFLIRGINSLIMLGKLGYIIPPYWLTAHATKKLKKYIIRNAELIRVYDFGNEKIFDDAQINGNIFVFSKDTSKNSPIEICKFNKEISSFTSYFSRYHNKDLQTRAWNIFNEKNSQDYFSNLKTRKLGEIATISPGIQTGSDRVSESHIKKLNLQGYNINEGIFVVSKDEVRKLHLSNDEMVYIKPFYKSSQIERYYSSLHTDQYIIVTNEIHNIEDFPNIKKHLLRYKLILDSRYRNYALQKADKEGKWFALYGYRPNTNFENAKIITPYRSKLNRFSYSDTPYYGSIDVFYIDIYDKNFNIYYVLAILNSDLILYWLDKNCKKKGENLELYAEPLSYLPIRVSDSNVQNRIAQKVKKVIQLKKELFKENNLKLIVQNEDIMNNYMIKIQRLNEIKNQINVLQHEINQMIYEIYQISIEEQHNIQRYLIENIEEYKKLIQVERSVDTSIEIDFSDLHFIINEYLKEEIITILKFYNKYISLDDIRNITADKYINFEELMNIMRKDNPTKKSKDIVKEALNEFTDTWNSYIKKRNEGKEPKELVKYYDSTYYGLSEWDDEIHKEYFIDAIKKYTEINPNEKKARDILKLFEGLNIKDKEDYIEIFNSQIKKAFRK